MSMVPCYVGLDYHDDTIRVCAIAEDKTVLLNRNVPNDPSWVMLTVGRVSDQGELKGTGIKSVAELIIGIGTALAGCPSHRSVRAELPHTALTSDHDDQAARRDRIPVCRYSYAQQSARPGRPALCPAR